MIEPTPATQYRFTLYSPTLSLLPYPIKKESLVSNTRSLYSISTFPTSFQPFEIASPTHPVPYPVQASYHLTNLRHSVHISDTFDIRVSCIHTYFERFINNFYCTYISPFYSYAITSKFFSSPPNRCQPTLCYDLDHDHDHGDEFGHVPDDVEDEDVIPGRGPGHGL